MMLPLNLNLQLNTTRTRDCCCTEVPGSNPARHPSLGSAQENPGAEKYRRRFFPAQQQEIPAQQQAYQPITKDEYCINTVDRKLEK